MNVRLSTLTHLQEVDELLTVVDWIVKMIGGEDYHWYYYSGLIALNTDRKKRITKITPLLQDQQASNYLLANNMTESLK